ncbi:hypothetical protein Hypma_009616 [Hypsizygus marmoreus]|uniref:Uncharacterized protein n=1 Tax=Hypsizygus marmoreus TaxID=39966 RepID=A0A369JV19_HYPMA|nr:hypothetical protein Hypma_009616 [Hypsizygus marmoreus]
MMAFRWSWIFILYSLLVRLGIATVPNNEDTGDGIQDRSEAFDSNAYLVVTNSDATMSKANVGAIVAAVIGGIALSFAVLGWCFISRKRKVAPHVEEGVRSPRLRQEGWIPDLKSEFSPDENERSKRRFDRIRAAFGRPANKPPLENILPVFKVVLPPGSTDSVDRPPPAVPNHLPKYPSSLERGYSKRPHPPPPPLEGYPDLSRTPSMTESLLDAQPGDRASRRKVQVPPKVLLVPPPGRPLPGLASSRSAGRAPRSPSRHRSWLSKHSFKHPFIPLRNGDATLKFPPGSPLGQYQPSRQHLEARLQTGSPRREVMSPRLRSPRPGSPLSAKTPMREPIRRQPVPLYEEDIATTKQARLVEALQSAGVESHRSPVQVNNPGYRTAVPSSSKHPPNSSRLAPPEVPTSAYI